MASGWARDGAVQDQIDASVEDAVERARNRLPRGVRLCVGCQGERDRHDATHAGYNRRGSKDSQLR